ncbi:MAG: hypothetical protein ABSB53_03125 [Nitrososphaerales archaeon]|jgi:hypothetical protein
MEKLPFKARLEKDGTLALPTPSELSPGDAMIWSAMLQVIGREKRKVRILISQDGEIFYRAEGPPGRAAERTPG